MRLGRHRIYDLDPHEIEGIKSNGGIKKLDDNTGQEYLTNKHYRNDDKNKPEGKMYCDKCDRRKDNLYITKLGWLCLTCFINVEEKFHGMPIAVVDNIFKTLRKGRD